MIETRPGICRLCTAFCPILVDIEDGIAVRVRGDPSNDLFRGYTCPKGRALPQQHVSPQRLMHSLKRGEDGARRSIDVEQAMDEIAAKLTAIIASHGPRSVAVYMGTGSLPYPASMPVVRSWLRGLGSAMFFTPGSIDQPGKSIAAALHGGWRAGEQLFEEADTYLLVGMNPVITKCHGNLGQNPGRKLKDAVARGMQMIVIDPRLTETARRAALHLKVRPGEDPTLLSAIVRVVLEEQLYDHAFVAENAEGLELLWQAVDAYTPDYASERTDVPVDDIRRAARIFAGARRGCAIAGTGPSFATRGTVTEYLCLCLNTLCGRWSRAGDKVPRPNVMLPPHTPRAQPIPPFRGWGYGEKMRVRGLTASAAGLPTAALADEILLDGEGQVRALFCIGGNPMMAWPDQRRTRAALDKIELLVTIDPELSATAELADYVIAPMMSLECPGLSLSVEGLKYYGFGLGFPQPWAQYAPRLTEPPAGSDLIEDWLFFHGLARRMGVPLKLLSSFRAGSYAEGEAVFFEVDAEVPPTTEAILEEMTRTSRVPLDEIKRHPHGRLYDFDERVLPREDDCTDRLQLGAEYVMTELATIRAEDYRTLRQDEEYPFLLVSRRANNFINSIGRSIDTLTAGRGYNPLFVNPQDLAVLGLSPGQGVEIRSAHDAIRGVVEADDTLRRGVVAITQNFGGQPDEDHRYREIGCNTNRLMATDLDYDTITGIPRMGAIPVTIAALASDVELPLPAQVAVPVPVPVA